MLGMYLKDLDNGVFKEILIRYDRAVGGYAQELFFNKNSGKIAGAVSQINECVKNGICAEFKLGSDNYWFNREPKSALIVRDVTPKGCVEKMIRFAFESRTHPDVDSSDNVQRQIQLFSKRIDWFFLSRDLAVYVDDQGHNRFDKLYAAVLDPSGDASSENLRRIIGEVRRIGDELHDRSWMGCYDWQCFSIRIEQLKGRLDAIELDGNQKDLLFDLASIIEAMGWERFELSNAH